MRRKDPPNPRPLERGTAERLAEIVEAAERAAASVIDDAETEARRYLADARREADRLASERLSALRELTTSLIAEAESIWRQSEALLSSLEEARRLLDEETDRPRPARGPHLSAVTPVAEPPLREAGPRPLEPSSSARDDGAGERRPRNPAGARLLATQMAVSGASRGEIAKTLRNGFEIDDAEAILDAILGPEE